MLQLRRFLLSVTVIASIVVSVKASAAKADITHRINIMQGEIVKVNGEKEALRAEIKHVENQLNEMTKHYEAKLSSTGAALENEKSVLNQLTFLTVKLIQERDEQNCSYLYLKELSKNVRYSLSLVQEDLEILKNRRSVGREKDCHYYLDQRLDHHCVGSVAQPKISLRSFTDTAEFYSTEILNLVTTHDFVKSDLSSAIHERDRLKLLLHQKKELLAGNMKSYQAEINEKLRTLTSIQEKSQSLQELVKHYKTVVKNLRLLNRELQSTVQNDRQLFSNINQNLNSEYRKAITCYKGIVPRTQTQFKNFLHYKKTYDETMSNDSSDGDVIEALDSNDNGITENEINFEDTTTSEPNSDISSMW